MATTILNLSNDVINKSMVDGLLQTFRYELKKELMPIAEKTVDTLVESLSKRMELHINSMTEFDSMARHIKLEWILRKED
jgi:hypothetical protein